MRVMSVDDYYSGKGGVVKLWWLRDFY